MYKARVNFSGVVSMNVGDVRNIEDVNIAKDLLKAGYIEEVKPAKKAQTEKAETKEPPKKRTTRKKG
jgi:hypothetical protein